MKRRSPVPPAAWYALAVWGVISGFLLWRSWSPGMQPEAMAVWAATFAGLGYTATTILLVFLTWRLYTLATEATTQTERAHRASHAPLLMAKISAVVSTGAGRSLRLDIANVGEGAAYAIHTESYLRPEVGKPDGVTPHAVALPKGQTVTVLLDVTWIVRLFRERLHDLIQASLPAGVTFPRRDDNYETLTSFDEDLRDLCSFLDCDFVIEVSYADLYGAQTRTTIVIPHGELALQRVAKVDREQTGVSARISHEIETSFDPGEELGDAYQIDFKHPGYWPSAVQQIRIVSHPESSEPPI